MEIGLLVDNYNDLKQVAQWYFEQWDCKTPGRRLDNVIDRLSHSLNRNEPPMLLIAKDAGKLVGAVELKLYEMDIYPDYKYWLGGLYIRPNFRGKSLSNILVYDLLVRAKKLEINQIYLQTFKLNGGLYINCGFKPLEKVSYKGKQVLVMVANTQI